MKLIDHIRNLLEGTFDDQYDIYAEKVNYFLHEKPEYTPYMYPHPGVMG
jgi:hypothetical protein